MPRKDNIMRSKTYFNKQSAIDARKQLYYKYMEKYFNLWLSSWQWPELTREQREYIMRRFWAEGQVAAFDIIGKTKTFLGSVTPTDTALTFQKDTAFLGFAPFAAVGYDMYNFPTRVQLINSRGVPYVPNQIQVNNEDVVLGFAQHSRQPVKAIVEIDVNRIVDVDMTIRTNLIAQKMPFAIEVTPESQQHAEELMASILGDEPAFYINVKETDSLKPVTTMTPYIIDKLYTYKQNLENELNTFLGIDNIGGVEKKERLVTDEAQSNDNIINDFSDSIGDNLKEFCSYVKSVLGYEISVKPTNSPKEAQQGEPDESQEEKPNNGNND